MKIYRMRVAAAPSAGTAAAGVTWFDVSGRQLAKHALRLGPAPAAAALDAPGPAVGMAVLAPPDAAAAAVWVGKWDRNGTLAVRKPCCYLPAARLWQQRAAGIGACCRTCSRRVRHMHSLKFIAAVPVKRILGAAAQQGLASWHIIICAFDRIQRLVIAFVSESFVYRLAQIRDCRLAGRWVARWTRNVSACGRMLPASTTIRSTTVQHACKDRRHRACMKQQPARVQVKELSFGGALGGMLDVNASAVARALPRAGAGLCLNYLLDGPGADNGTAFTQALQAWPIPALSSTSCARSGCSSMESGHAKRRGLSIPFRRQSVVPVKHCSLLMLFVILFLVHLYFL